MTDVRDLNELKNNTYSMTINRLPSVAFNCTEVSIPSITAAHTETNGTNSILKNPGTLISYEPVTIEFIVNESMSNWYNLWQWVESYKTEDTTATRDDISVVITDNHGGANLSFRYVDAFPTNIDEIVFSSTVGTPSVQKCRVTFEINGLVVESS